MPQKALADKAQVLAREEQAFAREEQAEARLRERLRAAGIDPDRE